MQKDTKIALGFTVFIVGLVFVGTFLSGPGVSTDFSGGNAVAVEDGVQVITIGVKGGYSPNRIEAKAGVPTELRFVTNGTYDCSSVLAIPPLGYQKTLASTGIERVTLGSNQATGTLKGQCAMGMYHFEVAFR